MKTLVVTPSLMELSRQHGSDEGAQLTVKILKFGIPQTIAIIVLKIEKV